MSARSAITRNPFFQRQCGDDVLPSSPGDVLGFHQSLPGYAPTPLRPLDELAAELGVKHLGLKDESARFGLNAFKVLGASYAIHRFLTEQPQPKRWTFATATDGNHGRAVAWTAHSLGHDAVVFVPDNTVPARIDAIANAGARVVVVDGTYDLAVRRAAEEAAANGWQVISDTGYPGYTHIPEWIMEGYTTLFEETFSELRRLGREDPDVVFLQAGVGGLACAGVRFFRRRCVSAPSHRLPRLIVVEPADADGLFESISSPDGTMREAKGAQRSIMAGLNCGTPSLTAWPLLRQGVDTFLRIDDQWSEQAIRRLWREGIVSGESGAAGLAGLMAIAEDPDARAIADLGPDASVLVISTEGVTDPVNWTRITEQE